MATIKLTKQDADAARKWAASEGRLSGQFEKTTAKSHKSATQSRELVVARASSPQKIQKK